MPRQHREEPRSLDSTRYDIRDFMTKRSEVLGALFLALIIVGCNAPDDFLIVPGKRVGSIVIGRTKASEIDDNNGHLLDVYNNRYLSIGVDLHSRVGSVEIYKPNYTTTKGIRVGARESAVVAAYGQPDEIVEVPIMAGKVQIALHCKRAFHYPGILFLMDEHHQVHSIIVNSH